MRKCGKIFRDSFRGRSILADEDHAVSKEILRQIERVQNDATQSHSKTCFIRFDVRFPSDYPVSPDNAVFQDFISSLTLSLKRSGLSPRYLWCREQSSSPHQHYHLALWVDGRKVRSSRSVIQAASKYWGMALSLPSAAGLIQDCGSKMLIRSSDSYVKDCDSVFEWASYLSKVAGKSRAPRGVREFGCSQSRRPRRPR